MIYSNEEYNMYLTGLSSIAFTLVEPGVLELMIPSVVRTPFMNWECPGFDPQSNLFFLFLQRGLWRNKF